MSYENFNSILVKTDELDPTILHLIIDRTANRQILRADFLDVLSQYTLKTTADSQAVEVIRLMHRNPTLTRSEAARAISGLKDAADINALRKRSAHLDELLRGRLDRPRNRNKAFRTDYRDRLRKRILEIQPHLTVQKGTN